ncbi:hypothetical protein [Marinoscillum luteum]|uniref:Peptidase S74 domain-containing protein n=1 Tax=Marinoscillum luteum TaxID=861051 RepID=A0ABW7N8H6_9BACT
MSIKITVLILILFFSFQLSAQQDLEMQNKNIKNVNNITINDPGVNEGIQWLQSSANWTIDVSPETRTNNDGNLNLYGTSGNIVLWRPLRLKSDLQVLGSGDHYISNGNLGLGTTTPTSKLSIRNVGALDGVKLLDFSESNGESFLFKGNFLGTGASGNSVFIGSNASGYQSNIMTWRGDGNIGVGITNPNARMHLYKDASGSQTLLILEKNEGDINENSEINLDFVFTDDNTNGTPQARISSVANTDASNGGGMEAEGTADLKFWTASSVNSTTNNLVERMRITSQGHVGIGTTNPDPNFKLSVNGSIRSKEVKVEANWSDFVFYDNYELRTLEEVEKHIAENGHLPEIPSEAEVTENGINLGEMNAKLLQKIEEITLYMIDINKQVQQLTLENQELKEKVLSLENQ